MNEKQQILNHIFELLDKKIHDLKQAIQSSKESRATDTKSSAGDKFETGRAMMQMEIEKNESQLNKTLLIRNDLEKIKPEKAHAEITFGSLVKTSSGNYFISVALGKITVENTNYYCVSLAAPIGKAMYNKCVGDTVLFNNNKINILEIT